MNDFYKFASDSPYLTFFISMMVLNATASITAELIKLIGVLVRGQPQIINKVIEVSKK